MAQVTELCCTYLDGLLETPPDPAVVEIAAGSAFVGAAPAFEVWVGTVEEVLARLREEWPFWAARPGAVRPHVLAANRVRAALARAGYAAAVREMQPPVTPWRVAVVQVDGRQPVLLVADGRHSATLPVWAAMLERWAGEMPGKAYGLVLLADADDARFLQGKDVVWSTAGFLEREVGVHVAPPVGADQGSRIAWSSVLGSPNMNPASKGTDVAGTRTLLKLPITKPSGFQPRTRSG